MVLHSAINDKIQPIDMPLIVYSVVLYDTIIVYSTTHIVNKEKSGSRGDYGYCRVPGTRQLSPLEVGEYNSKLDPKKLSKNSNPSIWANKSGLSFGLNLLIHSLLATF